MKHPQDASLFPQEQHLFLSNLGKSEYSDKPPIRFTQCEEERSQRNKAVSAAGAQPNLVGVWEVSSWLEGIKPGEKGIEGSGSLY